MTPPAQVRQTVSGGAVLTTEVSGAGPALVFLHSGVTDRRGWQPQRVAFAPAWQVVTYDRRGYGDTPAVNEPYSDTTDLSRVLDELGIAQAVLVGTSKGGWIALDFALQFPERVRGLVLIGTAIRGAPVPEDWGAVIEAIGAQMEQARAAGDIGRLNELEAQVWLDGARSPGRVQGPVRDLFLEMNGRALRADEHGEERPAPDAWPRLHEIAAPTLLVVGDLELPHLRENSGHAARVMPRAELRVMPGTAHLPPLEQPDSFNALLAEFLHQLP